VPILATVCNAVNGLPLKARWQRPLRTHFPAARSEAAFLTDGLTHLDRYARIAERNIESITPD